MTDLLEVLTNLNPWWQDKKIKDVGIERDRYLDKLNKYLSAEEVVVLTGVRRSGKTTLLKQAIKNLLYDDIDPAKILFVNFDEPDINNLDNPMKQVLKTYEQEVNPDEGYLFLDEIQHIGDWEKTVKSLYDGGKHNVTLTGSSSKLLESKLGNLLSGRYLSINITPLNFSEYLKFKGLNISKKNLDLVSNKNKIMKHLKEYLEEGGFPRIVLEDDEELKKQLLTTYYESILYRDVLLAHNVRHTRALKELLHYLLSNFTSPYTYKKISENLGINFNTVKDYIDFLTESETLSELRKFSYSLKTQNKMPKKPYCVDNGLRNTISFKFSQDYGRLAENLVFIELHRQKNEIYYWQGKKEVDFVTKDGDNNLEAFNVTYSDDIKERELEGLKEFKDKYKENVKKLTLITRDTDGKEEGINYIPLWKWLLKDQYE